ncbi:MAG: hypothetical protein R3253_08695, partial [Longimicrobiales bacterium]|nr:hypothetical protein [Longimicrobiales bacterium]
DEAEELFSRALTLSPEDPYALAMLRTMHHLRGRDSLAIGRWRDSYSRAGVGDAEALDSLNAGYARGGYEPALRAVAELFVDRYERDWDPDDDGVVNVSVWQIGTLYTRAGDEDQAIRYLSLALDEGDTNSLSIAVDPIFDPMRDDPRFQALVDRLRLPPPPASR